MSLEEFAAKLQQLEDPFTDVQSRHAADQWLIQFRSSHSAWAVAQAGLSGPPGLRASAAQILAFKTKKQLDQLPIADQRGALLESIVSVLASNTLCTDLAAVRALCITISNLIINSPDIARPLETLGSRFNQDLMLELLTVLPGEIEDCYEATQHVSINGASEFALQLKQRAQEWCTEVGVWLYTCQASILQSDPVLRGMPHPPANIEEAIQHAGPAVMGASIPLVRCFAAWVRWGGLFHMQKQHWEQLLRVAGGLMLLDPGPAPPEAVASGVEALSEAIERPSDEAQAVLLEISLRLPQQATVYAQNSVACGQLSHVYSAFCSVNSHLVASASPEGAALRNGLLHFVVLTPLASEGIDSVDEDEAGVPAVDALGDVLETVLDNNGAGNDDDGRYPPLTNVERLQFAATVLTVLMQQTLCPKEVLVQWPGASEMPAMPAMLSAVRSQAEWPLWLCGEVLTADLLTKHIVESFQCVVAHRGISSGEALRTLDTSFYVLRAASGTFTEHPIQQGGPPPTWLSHLLSLYAAAQQVVPSQIQQSNAPRTIFHRDLLASFAAIGPALTKALASAPLDQSRGLIDLILGHAVAAINAQGEMSGGDGFENDEEESGESVVDAAADAVRAMLSSPAEVQTIALGAGALSSIDGMLATLLSPQRRQSSAARKACRQLLVALVYAVHAADHGAAATAHSILRARALEPLVQAAQAAASSRTSSTGTVSKLMALHSLLADVQSVLNSLESFADLGFLPSDRPAAEAAVSDAVAACLTAWPEIVSSLEAAHGFSAASTIDSSSATSTTALIYQDAAHCLTSCIHLSPVLIAASLTPLVESICNSFFLQGGHFMHSTLCAALETFGAQPANQPVLVSAVGSLLTAPAAQKFYAIAGGDMDPEICAALLTTATSLLRQAASQWSQLPLPGPVIECVRLALHLAAANAACNHKDISQRAVAVLSASLVLMLDTTSPLHTGLIELASREGAVIMQGVMLCLLSLHSASFLPKVVTLMSDAAIVATACCAVPAGADVVAVTAAASAVLQGWWVGARQILEGSNAVPSAANDAVLGAWNWGPVVEAAATARVGPSGRSAGAEVRKGVQRAVRQLADRIRRG